MNDVPSESWSLADIGKEIFRLFRAILTSTASASSLDPIDASTLRLISAEGERFKLWAVSLGLLVPGHGSLDYRVREAESLANILRRFLSDLSNSLHEGRYSECDHS